MAGRCHVPAGSSLNDVSVIHHLSPRPSVIAEGSYSSAGAPHSRQKLSCPSRIAGSPVTPRSARSADIQETKPWTPYEPYFSVGQYGAVAARDNVGNGAPTAEIPNA